MNADPLEVIPSTWDEDRDTAFFEITADLFGHVFCTRAGVLLSRFDRRPSTAPAAPELVPVPVRRLR